MDSQGSETQPKLKLRELCTPKTSVLQALPRMILLAALCVALVFTVSERHQTPQRDFGINRKRRQATRMAPYDAQREAVLLVFPD